MGLTVKKIARLKPGRPYGHCRNLRLKVRSATSKSWEFRYWDADGKERNMGLGPYPVLTIRRAEERAMEERRKLADGKDPLTEKRREKAKRANSITFHDATMKFYELHSGKWKSEKHRDTFLTTLETFAFDIIGPRACSAIDVTDVRAVLEQVHPDHPETTLWHAIPKTASMLRGRIEAVLSWATVNGYRTGDNPARWRGFLDKALPAPTKIKKPEPHPALPYAQVAEFMRELEALPGVPPKAVKFLILTGARTSEVLGAQRPEIDFEQKIWTVPSDRMKGAKVHRVPLCRSAIELLQALPHEEGNDYVFIGSQRGKGLGKYSLSTVLKRMNRRERRWLDPKLGRPVSVHGFRSTLMDWAHDVAGATKVLADMMLAHTVSDSVEASYRRSDLLVRRMRVMDQWDEFCSRPAPKITPLRANSALSA